VGDVTSPCRPFLLSPLSFFLRGLPVGASCLLKKLFRASVDKFFFNCCKDVNLKIESHSLTITLMKWACKWSYSYLNFDEGIKKRKCNIPIIFSPSALQFMNYKPMLRRLNPDNQGTYRLSNEHWFMDWFLLTYLFPSEVSVLPSRGSLP